MDHLVRCIWANSIISAFGRMAKTFSIRFHVACPGGQAQVTGKTQFQFSMFVAILNRLEECWLLISTLILWWAGHCSLRGGSNEKKVFETSIDGVINFKQKCLLTIEMRLTHLCPNGQGWKKRRSRPKINILQLTIQWLMIAWTPKLCVSVHFRV